MRLHLSEGGARPWHRAGAVWARGVAFAPDGALLIGAALADHLDGAGEDFAGRVAALDGTFAAVRTGEVAVAAVDRVRSMPLFYGRGAEGTWHLSDDARHVADRTGAQLDDPLAVAEFMLASATSGPSTLSTSVRQVQAGEAVTLGAGGATGTRYYRYGVAPLFDAPEEDLVEEGARLFDRAFERFLVSVQGQPIVVPLSAGLDSRLIAAMCVRGGRTDALCFSYGRRRSFEAQASRRVADALGLRWTFVPYANRAWHRWFASAGFQQFRRAATGLTAIEHEQDWPAVLALRERGLPEDAAFVPGHSGDFISGAFYAASPADFERDPVEWLWRRYYAEWPSQGLAPQVVAGLRDRIAERIEDAASPLEAFSKFGWQERQAKMIVNSIRVYEHHGFDWRLPLWLSGDVLDFWSRVPVELRRGRALYRRVVRRLVGDAVYDLPSTLRREPPLTGKLRRLTDRDAGRYGIWLGPRPLAAALRTRVEDLVADHTRAHPVVGPVVDAVVRPLARRPVPWATINGLLALSELNDLTREGSTLYLGRSGV
ncbi:MAG: asparagine synthase-related protein [Bacteroidota bacterium]